MRVVPVAARLGEDRVARRPLRVEPRAVWVVDVQAVHGARENRGEQVVVGGEAVHGDAAERGVHHLLGDRHRPAPALHLDGVGALLRGHLDGRLLDGLVAEEGGVVEHHRRGVVVDVHQGVMEDVVHRGLEEVVVDLGDVLAERVELVYGVIVARHPRRAHVLGRLAAAGVDVGHVELGGAVPHRGHQHVEVSEGAVDELLPRAANLLVVGHVETGEHVEHLGVAVLGLQELVRHDGVELVDARGLLDAVDHRGARWRVGLRGGEVEHESAVLAGVCQRYHGVEGAVHVAAGELLPPLAVEEGGVVHHADVVHGVRADVLRYHVKQIPGRHAVVRIQRAVPHPGCDGGKLAGDALHVVPGLGRHHARGRRGCVAHAVEVLVRRGVEASGTEDGTVEATVASVGVVDHLAEREAAQVLAKTGDVEQLGHGDRAHDSDELTGVAVVGQEVLTLGEGQRLRLDVGEVMHDAHGGQDLVGLVDHPDRLVAVLHEPAVELGALLPAARREAAVARQGAGYHVAVDQGLDGVLHRAALGGLVEAGDDDVLHLARGRPLAPDVLEGGAGVIDVARQRLADHAHLAVLAEGRVAALIDGVGHHVHVDQEPGHRGRPGEASLRRDARSLSRLHGAQLDVGTGDGAGVGGDHVPDRLREGRALVMGEAEHGVRDDLPAVVGRSLDAVDRVAQAHEGAGDVSVAGLLVAKGRGDALHHVVHDAVDGGVHVIGGGAGDLPAAAVAIGTSGVLKGASDGPLDRVAGDRQADARARPGLTVERQLAGLRVHQEVGDVGGVLRGRGVEGREHLVAVGVRAHVGHDRRVQHDASPGEELDHVGLDGLAALGRGVASPPCLERRPGVAQLGDAAREPLLPVGRLEHGCRVTHGHPKVLGHALGRPPVVRGVEDGAHVLGAHLRLGHVEAVVVGHHEHGAGGGPVGRGALAPLAHDLARGIRDVARSHRAGAVGLGAEVGVGQVGLGGLLGLRLGAVGGALAGHVGRQAVEAVTGARHDAAAERA